MVPSSDQTTPTTTPTDPDLHLSTTPQSNPHMAAPLTMSSHNHSPPTHAQAMEELEQIWSSLSLEHLQNETVSFVRIPIHLWTAMVWNQVSQSSSLPLRLELPAQPPTQPPPFHRPCSQIRVRCSGHPYHPPVRPSRALPVRQRSVPPSSSSADSSDPLPAAIFCFLDRSEVNIAMREDKPNLYIVVFSSHSLPFVVSGTHWAWLGNVEALYRIKTTTARHQ